MTPRQLVKATDWEHHFNFKWDLHPNKWCSYLATFWWRVWKEALTNPLRSHRRLVMVWAAGFAIRLFLILFYRLNHCSFTTWLSSSTVCPDDWQEVSEWNRLNYVCKKLMLLAWVQSIPSWHAENTEGEAFPCADQSVPRTALNLQITEVLSMFVLLPGVSFLQLYSKKQVWVGNN